MKQIYEEKRALARLRRFIRKNNRENPYGGFAIKEARTADVARQLGLYYLTATTIINAGTIAP